MLFHKYLISKHGTLYPPFSIAGFKVRTPKSEYRLCHLLFDFSKLFVS